MVLHEKNLGFERYEVDLENKSEDFSGSARPARCPWPSWTVTHSTGPTSSSSLSTRLRWSRGFCTRTRTVYEEGGAAWRAEFERRPRGQLDHPSTISISVPGAVSEKSSRGALADVAAPGQPSEYSTQTLAARLMFVGMTGSPGGHTRVSSPSL